MNASSLCADVAIASGSSDPDVHSSFAVPTVYYGAYAGDVDAGTNSFKRWFWEHKVPRSLYDNPTEPWSEICWDPITGALFNGTAPRPGQSLYAAAAATGVELVKIDWCALPSSSPAAEPTDTPRCLHVAAETQLHLRR